jgi:hypothetical protein
MTRQNFGFGVIIDLCRRHGIWFDAEKLTCILDGVRAGGQEAAYVELQTVSHRDGRVDGDRASTPIVGWPTLADNPYHDDGIVWGLSKAIGFVASIFTR